jgi:predicted HicB family RNase H-like nuclease
MLRETPRQGGPPADQDSTRFMQCRLPVAHYEWLRYRAFNERTSMNSIVLEAIDSMRRQSLDLTTPLALPVTAGTSGGVKFNVRLSENVYEWLRTKAFNSRGSINQLLIAALAEYRLRDETRS